jgi:hypothetical protein
MCSSAWCDWDPRLLQRHRRWSFRVQWDLWIDACNLSLSFDDDACARQRERATYVTHGGSHLVRVRVWHLSYGVWNTEFYGHGMTDCDGE